MLPCQKFQPPDQIPIVKAWGFFGTPWLLLIQIPELLQGLWKSGQYDECEGQQVWQFLASATKKKTSVHNPLIFIFIPKVSRRLKPHNDNHAYRLEPFIKCYVCNITWPQCLTVPNLFWAPFQCVCDRRREIPGSVVDPSPYVPSCLGKLHLHYKAITLVCFTCCLDPHVELYLTNISRGQCVFQKPHTLNLLSFSFQAQDRVQEADGSVLPSFFPKKNFEGLIIPRTIYNNISGQLLQRQMTRSAPASVVFATSSSSCPAYQTTGVCCIPLGCITPISVNILILVVFTTLSRLLPMFQQVLATCFFPDVYIYIYIYIYIYVQMFLYVWSCVCLNIY